MKPEQFVVHACEQVLRFTSVDAWDDLSEERKVQLAFNMGVVALGLGLSKEEGYMQLSNVQQKEISVKEFHEAVRLTLEARQIVINEENTSKSF